MGQGEDNMEVAGRKKFGSARGDPPFPRRRLTLWAMAISAAVIRDGGAMSAAGALIDVAAQSGGATARWPAGL